MMEIKSTQRGFAFIEFTDAYGEKCTLQKSSHIDPHIWFGRENNSKPHLGQTSSPRMHLNREQVKELLPFLVSFVETGNIENIAGAENPPPCKRPREDVFCHVANKYVTLDSGGGCSEYEDVCFNYFGIVRVDCEKHGTMVGVENVNGETVCRRCFFDALNNSMADMAIGVKNK